MYAYASITIDAFFSAWEIAARIGSRAVGCCAVMEGNMSLHPCKEDGQVDALFLHEIARRGSEAVPCYGVVCGDEQLSRLNRKLVGRTYAWP